MFSWYAGTGLFQYEVVFSTPCTLMKFFMENESVPTHIYAKIKHCRWL